MMERNITLREFRTSYSYKKAFKNLIMATSFVLLSSGLFYWFFGVKYPLSGYLVIMPFLLPLLFAVWMVISAVKFIKLRISPLDYVVYSAICVPGEMRVRNSKMNFSSSGCVLWIDVSFIDETGEKHYYGEKISIWRTSLLSGGFTCFNETEINIGYDKKRERYLIITDLDNFYHL